MDERLEERLRRYTSGGVLPPGIRSLDGVLAEVLDRGRRVESQRLADSKSSDGEGQRLGRRQSPTNSERMNRALVELSSSAFKVHMLLWKWRGAPARGRLPYFTLRSLSRFCGLSRPTVRKAIKELRDKGWIEGKGYDAHYKNTLYKLRAIREVRGPAST